MNTPPVPTPQPSAWRAYVYLYLPLLTSAVLILCIRNPFENRLLVAACGIPTYLVASVIYPTNRPGPSPDQSIRFTRKSDIYRVLVLFTYGRILGTPFNLAFFMLDVVLNYAVGAVIGEREAGEPQRWSELFVHILWTIASGIVWTYVIPPSWGMLSSLAGTVDRAMWRAAYLALVDDVIGVLAYPNLNTRKGKGGILLVETAMIFLIVLLVKFQMHMATIRPQPGDDPAEGVE